MRSTASILILFVQAVLLACKPLPLVALATFVLVLKLLERKLTMKRIRESGGFDGYSTNHSGKVTCASQLFEAQVDEQLIII